MTASVQIVFPNIVLSRAADVYVKHDTQTQTKNVGHLVQYIKRQDIVYVAQGRALY